MAAVSCLAQGAAAPCCCGASCDAVAGCGGGKDRFSGRGAGGGPAHCGGWRAVDRPAGAEVIDLGDTTLMPGMIDAHVHLFLHAGAEDLQTIQESVPQRTFIAEVAAKDD